MGIFDFFKRKRDPKEELKELLSGFELPHFPKAVMAALDAIRDTKSSLQEITDHIEADPGMHVMVLKTVNSAAFGLSRKVSSVDHAVSLLGRSRLESLLLPIAVKGALPKFDVSCMNSKQFWAVAARRGSLARMLAERLHPATEGESFTAGLLQDMGIPLIIMAKKEKYCPVIEAWNLDKETDLKTIEQEMYGFDHTAVGALMAEEWNFPEGLIRSILFHHGGNGDIEPAVSLVSHIRYGEDEETYRELIVTEAQEKFSIRKGEIAAMIEEAFEKAEELSAAMQ